MSSIRQVSGAAGVPTPTRTLVKFAKATVTAWERKPSLLERARSALTGAKPAPAEKLYDQDLFWVEASGVLPGAKLEVLNLSERPNADWSRDVRVLPGDTHKRLPAGRDGRSEDGYGLLLTRAEAHKLGILAGDQLLLRQRDGHGNTSAAVLLDMMQMGGEGLRDLRGFDRIGAETPPSRPQDGLALAMAIGDERSGVVVPGRITSRMEGNEAVVTLDRALEPGSQVFVNNLTHPAKARGFVKLESTVELRVKAQAGDRIAVYYADANFAEAPARVVLRAGEAHSQMVQSGQVGRDWSIER
jgi:hypothetical protein